MGLARDRSARKVIPTTFRPDHLSIRGADRDGGLDVVIVQDGRLGYRFFRLTGPPANGRLELDSVSFSSEVLPLGAAATT
jgi:hypothetical protein